MPRRYQASLNLDFTHQRTHHYQKLIAALMKSGWRYVETSALAISTTKLAKVWRGIELVARQAQDAGRVSALTFHIQSSMNFKGLPYKARRNHPNAVRSILGKGLPQP